MFCLLRVQSRYLIGIANGAFGARRPAANCLVRLMAPLGALLRRPASDAMTFEPYSGFGQTDMQSARRSTNTMLRVFIILATGTLIRSICRDHRRPTSTACRKWFGRAK